MCSEEEVLPSAPPNGQPSSSLTTWQSTGGAVALAWQVSHSSKLPKLGTPGGLLLGEHGKGHLSGEP